MGGKEYLRSRFGSPTDAVAWSLRSVITAAPGSRLLSADYANIEGRVLAWLAGEAWKLDAFRDYDALLLDANGEPIFSEKGEKLRNGPDLYILAFAKAFGIPIKDVVKAQRQIGKVMELALGYQGAHGAFVSMTKNYRIDLDMIAAAVKDAVSVDVWEYAIARYWDGARAEAEEIHADMRMARAVAAANGDDPNELPDPDFSPDVTQVAKTRRFGLEAEVWAAIRIIVDGWRAAHPGVVALWRGLNDAAIEAVQHSGVVSSYGRIAYKMGTIGGRPFLGCRLPSGRLLAYPYARLAFETVTLRDRTTGEPYEKRFPKLIYSGTSSKTRKWQTQRAYGGLLCENVVQAAARDVLTDAMLRLDARGYEITMHVHDEIVCEMPTGRGSFAEFSAAMAELEPWAEGLPVAVDGWEGERYRK